MASFLARADLQMVHIPLKGTGEIISELLAGRVHAAMVSAFGIKAYKDDPRLQLIASADTRRSDQFPELLTLHESGYPNFKWSAWTGLLAPAGTPISVVHEINLAMAKVLEDPKINNKLKKMGLSTYRMSVAQFESQLRDDWRQASDHLLRLTSSLD